jgi:hypothetical protein
LFLASGLWQSVRRPTLVTVQVPPGLPAVSGLALVAAPLTGALGPGDGLALGCGDALALGLGVVLAWANPLSARVMPAVRTIRGNQRPAPGGRFDFNVGPPRQNPTSPSRRDAEGRELSPVRTRW